MDRMILAHLTISLDFLYTKINHALGGARKEGFGSVLRFSPVKEVSPMHDIRASPQNGYSTLPIAVGAVTTVQRQGTNETCSVVVVPAHTDGHRDSTVT